MTHSFLPAFTLLAAMATGQATPRLMMTEVLVDPVGTNLGAQIVEVRSTGNATVDLSGWHMVTPKATVALPSVLIPPGFTSLIHLGRSGTSNTADLFLPSVPELSASSSIALFRSANVTNPNDLVDFVAWGGGQGAIDLAVAAWQWPSKLSSVTLPAKEGHTIAHFDRMSYGSIDVPEAWFQDGTPTIGGENDGGAIFVGRGGCTGLPFTAPQIGSGEEDNRPWVGERWILDVGYLPPSPTIFGLLVGRPPAVTIPLASAGMPNCDLGVLVDVAISVPVQPTLRRLQFVLPKDPVLVGAEVLFQGAVPYPGANAAGIVVTRVIHAFVGSR